jgi:hypothetical protein
MNFDASGFPSLMGYSLHANEVPFSTFRVSAAYLTSELAGRCGPMHIKQARGAEMICSGQSVCLPVLICMGGLYSISKVPIGKFHRPARTAPRRRSAPHRRVRIEPRRLRRRAFRDYHTIAP